MNVYNETVQEDLGPHWTNSGYQLTSSLDLDTDKLAPPYIHRVSVEFITDSHYVHQQISRGGGLGNAEYKVWVGVYPLRVETYFWTEFRIVHIA